MTDSGQPKSAPPLRPLSPHLQIYRPQLNSALSIFHRITGVGMAVTGVLIAWWFLAAIVSADYFDFVDGVLTSWAGKAVMGLSLLAFWFHLLNGVRHLNWDIARGLGIRRSLRTGWYVLGLTVVMAGFSLWIATRGGM